MANAIGALQATATAITIVGFLLNVTGLYILLSLRHSRMSSIQRWYLQHISATEVLLCAGHVIVTLLVTKVNPERLMRSDVYHVYEVVLQIVLPFMWYALMFTLTVDRFLAVFWNFKYPIYWSAARAHILTIAECIVSLALGVVAVVLHFAFGKGVIYTDELQTIYLVIDWLFVATVIVVYGYIVMKYRKSRSKFQINDSYSTSPCNHALNMQSIFRGSTFWVPTLILFTFALCVALPDLVIYHYTKANDSGERSVTVVSIMLVLMAAASSVDAMIYILLAPHVKNLLVKKLRNLFSKVCRRRINPSKSDAGSSTQTQMCSREGNNPPSSNS